MGDSRSAVEAQTVLRKVRHAQVARLSALSTPSFLSTAKIIGFGSSGASAAGAAKEGVKRPTQPRQTQPPP